MIFTKEAIHVEPATETERIVERLKQETVQILKRRGAVIGISGGVDSSVVLALCVRAFGTKHVLAVLMPEKDSSPESVTLAKDLAKKFAVEYIIEDMTAALTGLGCYRRRDEAVKQVFPEYDSHYKVKITLSGNILEKDSLNIFQGTIISPKGEEKTARLPLKEYLQIVAASNFKQRSRMSMLYFHAEARNYAVIGTGNKNEHQLGFFVKYGDGGADIKPIVHLFKTQIYQLAEYLDIPEEIRRRTPTSDTYSAEQTQEEFFFRLPFVILDTIWYGWEKGIPAAEMAAVLDLKTEQVENVIHDIRRKIAATEFLRKSPIQLE